MRSLAAVVALLGLGACDSDSVHWQVRSNPSGSGPAAGGGTTVIVVVESILPDRSGTIPDEPSPEGQREPVRVHLLTGVDEADLGDGDAVVRGRPVLHLESGR